MTAEEYTEALNAVTSYNGLADVVLSWLDLEFGKDSLRCPARYNMKVEGEVSNETIMDYAQLQVIWMIAVELFGEYGTSPRFGWIRTVNKEKFHQWIMDITALEREAQEYGLS